MSSLVADICIGKLDSAGAEIETVYAKVVPIYAVYRTNERVVVQYADDERLASDQRHALIALTPLKGEVNGLIDGWRTSEKAHQQARARLFDRRVADALQVGLQGDSVHGVELLAGVKGDLVAERTSIARTEYIGVSAAATLLATLIFWLLWRFSALTGTVSWIAFVDRLWFSAGIGATGAFFSTALAIRGRQIGIDLQWRDNYVDACLRIVIGSISAIILYCMMVSGLVDLGFGGGAPIGKAIGSITDMANGSAVAIVVAFIAGFSERLVGDMLNKAVISALSGKPGNPLAGAPVATPPPAGGKADEKNPLGKPPAPVLVLDRPSQPIGDPGADDAQDGCLDDASLDPNELTQDAELPEAVGGVVGEPGAKTVSTGGGI